MSGENEQTEEEKKADGGKIKIPAHLMAAKQAPVAKPAWMQRLASAKQVGGTRYQQAPEVNNDTPNEEKAEIPDASSNRRRTYKIKNVHAVLPTSTATDTESKETSDHALPPPPEPEREPEPAAQPVAESTDTGQPAIHDSQSPSQSQSSQSHESEIIDKPASLKEETQNESKTAMEEQVLQSSSSSNQQVFEDKTDEGSGTVEEVISTDDDSNEGSIVEIASSDSSSSHDSTASEVVVENSSPVATGTTQDPDATIPQSAVLPAIVHSVEEPSPTENVVTSRPVPAAATLEPVPSRPESSAAPLAERKPPLSPGPPPKRLMESSAVKTIPRRPSGNDEDDSFVPPRPTPVVEKQTSQYVPNKGDTLTLPRRPSLAPETDEPPSLSAPRAAPANPRDTSAGYGVSNNINHNAHYNNNDDTDDDDDDDDTENWMFPHRNEDDSSWVNPSRPIQPERKQHLTEELKKKSVDLFPENGQVSQRLAHLKSIDEGSKLNDFDYDPKVGFIVDPHVRGGGDGQTISETSFSEVSKMDSSAKIIETSVPKKDMDIWALPSQEVTYRAVGKLDTHKDGKDYRFSYIAQPHTHSTASYADVVRERYFPKENNEYWAAPAREAPPELPIHISREGTIQTGPSDENESWMPPELDPNQPPVDKNKIYAPTLADEKYSEARSVVSDGSDWIGRGAMTARVDFAGSVNNDPNSDSFEWNPPRDAEQDPESGKHDEGESDDDDSESGESEESYDLPAANAKSATPRPPSPPAALHSKRAAESAPKDKADANEAGYDYSSSGRLKFDLTPKMIVIEDNAAKGNSKSQDQLRCRCYLFIFFLLLVVLGGVACIVIFVVDPFDINNDSSSPAGPDSVPTMEPTSWGGDGPTKAPSPTATFFPGPAQNPSKPTSSMDEDVLVQFLSKISSDNGEALKDSSSPQYAAMQWLLSSANIGIYKDATLIQRYALATLYYATGGEQWLDSSEWLTDASECDWYSSSDLGSICDIDENLLELNLRGNSLTGFLPPELNLLSNSLTTLHLGDNKISGQIPSELSALLNLETLQLSQNQFRGTIPTAFGTMQSLKTLFLFQNSLRSSIPTQLGEVTTMKELDLGANRLTGAIPTELGQLTDLISLSLYGNDLTGSIPSQLSELTNLRVLYLDANDLGPSLPDSICLNLKLDEFWSDCNEIGGCECCTKCCQDGETCE